MTKPLTFEEWKEKHRISVSKAVEEIANQYDMISDLITDNLNEFLKRDYKLYLYQVNNPNWYEVLKDTDSDVRKIRDDWETIVDAENASQVR